MHSFEELKEVVAELRSEHGCPWDREQTFESLKPYLLEESGEVLQAIDNHDMENLCEELGYFTIHDVVDGVCEKMIRRHPHVFGDAVAETPEESLALWRAIKKQEKAKKP